MSFKVVVNPEALNHHRRQGQKVQGSIVYIVNATIVATMVAVIAFCAFAVSTVCPGNRISMYW